MRSLRSKIQETLGLPGHEFHGEADLLERVAALVKLRKQEELVELSNKAAREGLRGAAVNVEPFLVESGRLREVLLPEGLELLVNGKPAELGQTIHKDDKLSLRNGMQVATSVYIHNGPAMEHWRTLLALADDAAGGRIDEDEWAGLARNFYALLRAEQAK